MKKPQYSLSDQRTKRSPILICRPLSTFSPKPSARIKNGSPEAQTYRLSSTQWFKTTKVRCKTRRTKRGEKSWFAWIFQGFHKNKSCFFLSVWDASCWRHMSWCFSLLFLFRRIWDSLWTCSETWFSIFSPCFKTSTTKILKEFYNSPSFCNSILCPKSN